MVTELGEFPCDDVLSPEWILLPHPADQGSGVRIDGRTTDRSARSVPPEQPPERPVPSDHGLRPDDGNGVDRGGKQLGHRGDGEAVARF
jgi:hypothetical protein